MKTVFTNDMTAHVWAQCKQPHGRNSSNSMHFDGSTAYSYAEPVAHIVTTPACARVALFTSRTWSVTTSRQVSLYKRALASDVPAFNVPDLLLGRFNVTKAEFVDSHKANIEHFKREYETERKRLMACMADSWRLAELSETTVGERETRAHENLCMYANELERYCRAFSLEIQALPWETDGDAAIARRDRILSDPKLKAKREAKAERERIEKARLRFERDTAARARFRTGEPRTWSMNCGDESGNALLRLSADGLTVETSQGADAPLADVRRVLALYARVWWDGQPAWTPHASFKTEATLGSFMLHAINADGSVKVGCHTFSAAEIARFRELLASADRIAAPFIMGA